MISIKWSIMTLILALIVTTLSTLHAAEVTLAWDPNLEPDIAGYRLYYGQPPGTEAGAIELGNFTTYTVEDLTEGATYFFYVTCHSTMGLESEPSNTIEYTVPGTVPDPELRIVETRLDGYDVTITWTSVAGGSYRIVYKANLTDPDWQPLSEELLGIGARTTFADSLGDSGVAQRYYAVERVGP